jgi:hypothetical protein
MLTHIDFLESPGVGVTRVATVNGVNHSSMLHDAELDTVIHA